MKKSFLFGILIQIMICSTSIGQQVDSIPRVRIPSRSTPMPVKILESDATNKTGNFSTSPDLLQYRKKYNGDSPVSSQTNLLNFDQPYFDAGVSGQGYIPQISGLGNIGLGFGGNYPGLIGGTGYSGLGGYAGGYSGGIGGGYPGFGLGGLGGGLGYAGGHGHGFVGNGFFPYHRRPTILAHRVYLNYIDGSRGFYRGGFGGGYNGNGDFFSSLKDKFGSLFSGFGKNDGFSGGGFKGGKGGYRQPFYHGGGGGYGFGGGLTRPGYGAPGK